MDNQNTISGRYRWTRILITLMIISGLIAGCRLPWQAKSDVATKEADVLDAEQASTPTRPPRVDLPPALVEISPLPESLIGLKEPITLYFNQAMDASSVEAAIHFDPRTSGLFTWEDPQTVTFSPDQPLTAGSRLRLALDTSAQAVNRKNLQEPIELNFQVSESLKVVQTLPKDGTRDVDPESIIFVSFNQPVVALGGSLDADPGFTLSPEVSGSGVWLNTSTYVYTPTTSMDGGTVYTLQLNQNLVAVSGARLSSSVSTQFSFTTTDPVVLKVLPMPGELLGLDGTIEIQFNMRMNPESVEDQLSLVGPGGVEVLGTYDWNENSRTVTFMPNRNLTRDSRYSLRLGSEAESLGGLSIVETVETSWQTFPSLNIDKNRPPEFSAYYGGYGQYLLNFTALLDADTVDEFVSLSPEVTGERFFVNEADRRLFINGYFQPETTYTLTLDADLQDMWGGRLGEGFTTTFLTPPAEPSLNVISGYTSYNLIFVPSSESELVMQATNINQISLEIAPISINDLITLLHPDNYRYREIFLPEVREVSTHSLNLSSNRNEVISLPLAYQDNPLTPGVYYLGVSTPDIDPSEFQSNQKYYLIVSENNLVMKVTPEQAFVWGSRLIDFAPLVDAPLWIYNTEGEVVTRGSLDAEGLFLDKFKRIEDSISNYFTVVGEPGQAEFAFSISTWQEGYLLFEQGIQVDILPALIDAYIYTDRPIYRPGDTIHFKTVVFSRENGLPVMPDVNTLRVSINSDPGQTGKPSTLYSEALALSEFGTAAGSFILKEDSPTGYYWIDLSIEDNLIKALYFDVADYRKPDIELKVTFDQADALIFEELSAGAQADYYFGLPAAGQNYTWSLYRKDINFNLPRYHVGPVDEFSFRSYYPGFSPLGDLVTYGEGVTGDEGQVSLSFTEDDLELEEQPKGQLQQYSLEVTVMDQSGFPVSHRDTMLVHPEAYYIGVQPEMYFGSAGSAFNFSVLSVDWDKAPSGDIPLEAIFEAITWEVEETGNPEAPYAYVTTTNIIGSASARTNLEGEARVSFTPPDPGTYRLTLASGDAVTQVTVWVTGEGAAIWPALTQNQIDLTADSSDYQPGQIAQIFIPNPFNGGAKALVTTERGEIMSTQLLDISGPGYTLGIPITQASIPNVYVSVILVGDNADGKPDYRQGTLTLSVPPLSKTLNVELSLDAELAEPGDLVTLTLKISDQSGMPMQGEFSIAVVDKALLALVDPNSPPILDALYGEIPLSVQTSLTLYTYAKQFGLTVMDLGGMGGGAEREADAAIREDFPDTAFWQANVVTGADGTAQLTIPLPDTLTTWVVDARGLTDEYMVGQAEVEVQTQKPLMIRPVTPRFLVDGDEVEMAAVVHNNTDSTLDVDVSLEGVGFAIVDANPTQRVTIPSGESRRLTWWGIVESVDVVDLVFKAVSGSLSDASTPVWGELQVKRYAMPYTLSTAGQLVEAGSRLELVSLPISTDPSSGELSLVLNPSLLVTLVDGIKALETHPYNATVSILSRLLANLNAFLVLSNLEIDSPELLLELDQQIQSGINQLLAAQNFDGGWSWWVSSSTEMPSSDPFISAYVLLGLEQAYQAGMDVGDDFIIGAKDYMIYQLEKPGEIESAWKLDQLVFQTYALREHDFDLTATFDGLYARRSELSPWGLGLLALTLQERGGMAARVSTLVTDLEGRAIRSATGVHWENERSSWMLPGTPVFNSAVGVFSLAQLDPASTSLPLALRYLMAHRDSEKLWSSTFESAWSLMAIAKALQGMGDYQADYDFQATLNDVLIAEGVAAGPESLNTFTTTTPIETLYPDSPNALMIERGAGAGTLYYRVDLQTYQPAATAQAIQRGINLDRDYYLAGEGCPGEEGCLPIDSIELDLDQPSKFITVALTVNLAHDMYNLMIEDFIPAGTEVFNRAFLTSQTLPEESGPFYDPRYPFANGWGWWYFNQPQIYDDHVLWTADFVPAGTYVLTYTLLPYQYGTYQVLPAHAWQYFYPEVQGTSSGMLFTIE